MKDYILVVDSGLGGVSVLNKLLFNLSGYNYIYFADSGFAPYGNKSSFVLKRHLKLVIKSLLKTYNIKIVVLACNTATSVAIKYLRKTFKDIIFVGTEPAIKPAKINHKKILVLATVATIKHNRTLKKYNSCNITNLPQKTLAKLIDDNLEDLTQIGDDLKNLFVGVDKDYDAVVLGCTHYVFIKPMLEKLFCKAEFFDSGDGVTNRVRDMIERISLQKSPSGSLILLDSSGGQMVDKIKNYVKSL